MRKNLKNNTQVYFQTGIKKNNMRQLMLLENETCNECGEEIMSGEYAWTDDFEDMTLCDSCKEHKEEYFGDGYTAKMD